MGGRLARLAALVVLARDQGVLHAGIGDHEADARGDGDVADLEAAAVNEGDVAGLAEDGGDLVEQAALHPGVAVLGGLADLRQLELVQGMAEGVLEEEGGGGLQGGAAG